jgi:hypothetical protein
MYCRDIERWYGRRGGKRFGRQQQIIGPLVRIGPPDLSFRSRRVRAVRAWPAT